MAGKIEEKGLWLWIGAAMAAPMGQWLGNSSWPWVVAASLGAGALFLLVNKVTGEEKPGKLIAVLQILFLIVAVGAAAAHAGACWLTAKVEWIIPAVLLVLAACSASGSSVAAQRAGATVFWFVALGFCVLLAFALPDVKAGYLRPAQGQMVGLPVILIPGVVFLLPRKKGKQPWKQFLLLTVAAGLISGLTAGVLSPEVAAGTKGAFMEMVRGIRVLGAAERLEALAAAVMTLSWFGLMSLFLAAAGEMGQIICPGKRALFVWLTAGLGAAVCLVAEGVAAIVLALGAVFFWYLLPSVKGLGKRRK